MPSNAMSTTAHNADDGLVKPFLDHLEDLRRTLLRGAAVLALGMVIAFPLAPHLLGVLKQPLYLVTDNPDAMLQSMEVAGAFVAAMRIAFWGGILLSSPLLVIIIGQFVLPALTAPEKKLAGQAGALGALLFIGGVAFGYVYTLPFALSAMYLFNDWLGVAPLWTLSSYVTFAVQVLVAFGLAFEIPMVLLVLGRLGIVSGEWLRTHRRHAIVGALIIACILTPPDVVSQIVMTIPLVILYEACIWIVLAWDRKRVAGNAITPAGDPAGPEDPR